MANELKEKVEGDDERTEQKHLMKADGFAYCTASNLHLNRDISMKMARKTFGYQCKLDHVLMQQKLFDWEIILDPRICLLLGTGETPSVS